ncbi:uncharacterized protein LOC119364378 isoform X2 [Triticum dicoccoides]|nr:uncharacterized protein LOC119364378 isoform X2 [Triticum dicoccoides]
MPGGTEVAHHSMKHRSRSVGIWLRSGDLGQRQAHRSQLQSSLLRRGVGTRACSRCYHFFCFDHGSTTHLYREHKEQKAGACCFQGDTYLIPLLWQQPSASATRWRRCLPLLPSAAAACHCSLPRAQWRTCRTSPARASSPTRVHPPRSSVATTAPPGRPASLPSPFLLPPLVLLLLSHTHQFTLSLLPTGGRRRTASSCRLEVLCHRSPPPHPRRLRPSSSDPMLQGLPAPPPPRQVRLLKPLLSADCSIPCLDHVRVRAQGMQGPATLLGVHVRWQVEVGAGEQAVERIDGAMVEVMGAELLHPPRADSWLLADEHRGARVLGNGDTPIGVRRCWRRRRGAGTFRTDELVNERSLPLSTFSAAG